MICFLFIGYQNKSTINYTYLIEEVYLQISNKSHIEKERKISSLFSGCHGFIEAIITLKAIREYCAANTPTLINTCQICITPCL